MFIPIPHQLGYAAVGGFILGESAGLPLPGETALIAGASLAVAGHLSLPIVVLVATIAAILGDTAGYLLGRRGGRAFLLRDGLGGAHRRHAVARADVFFARYGMAAVFLGRWVPLVRIVAGPCAGAAQMPWRRFAVANAAGALTWATTVGTLAWLLGPGGATAMAAGGLLLGAATTAMVWLHHRRQAPAPNSAEA